MSPIEQIIADFTARLAADTGQAWSSANVKLGKRYLVTTQSSPHIVIVPEGGQLSAEDVRPGGNPRILLVRTVTLRFFCFGGKSYQSAEALLHNAIRAIRNEIHAAFTPGDETWISEDPSVRDIDSHLISFSVSVQIPVYDLVLTEVEPVAHDFTYLNNAENIPLTDP